MATVTSELSVQNHAHTAKMRLATEKDISRLPSRYSIKEKAIDTASMVYDLNPVKTLACDEQCFLAKTFSRNKKQDEKKNSHRFPY